MILIVACESHTDRLSISTESPTSIPIIIRASSPSPTFTPYPTQTLFPTFTELPTQTSFPTKPVIISYDLGIGDGVFFGGYLCLEGLEEHYFILYSDGQLIQMTSHGLVEGKLSAEEISILLEHIQQTGFFQVDIRDEYPLNIYNDPPWEPYYGAPIYHIQVRDQAVSFDSSLEKYLIEPISQTLEIINTFTTHNMVAYKPQLLRLWVYNYAKFNSIKTGVWPTPIPPILLWPSNMPKLSTLEQPDYANEDPNHAILDNTQAASIISHFQSLPGNRVFTQEGVDYLVAVCPVEP